MKRSKDMKRSRPKAVKNRNAPAELIQVNAVNALEQQLKMLSQCANASCPIGPEPNHEKFSRYVELFIMCAEKLAPYQNPKIAAGSLPPHKNSEMKFEWGKD